MLSAILLASCSRDYRPRASGQTGTVTVVMDTTDWRGIVGEATRALFQDDIQTLPQVEPMFSLDYVDLTSIDQFDRSIRPRKYLFFAGALDDTSNVARFVTSRLDSTHQAEVLRGEAGLFQEEDAWMSEQLVFFATATSDTALAGTIRENAESVRFHYNNATRRHMEREMFSRLRQTEIEEAMQDSHSFSVKVQHDYLVAVDTTNFYWMRRFVDDTNWRNLFVYYAEDADPAPITLPWVVEVRDRLTETWLTGNLDDFVLIDQRLPLEAKEIDFLGRYGLETRGLWHMVGYDSEGQLRNAGGGGPFVNYTFYDEEQGRIYMIDGMVFAPKYEKRELLRQMEVIAHTFKTRQDSEREQEAPPVANRTEKQQVEIRQTTQ
jgi:hypothetical protein